MREWIEELVGWDSRRIDGNHQNAFDAIFGSLTNSAHTQEPQEILAHAIPLTSLSGIRYNPPRQT